MVPARRGRGPARRAAPRTRGDGPSALGAKVEDLGCSPHPRGWSLRRGHPFRGRRLLPAPAGMVPFRYISIAPCQPAPRTRGDGPSRRPANTAAPSCSPHPRGWSLEEAGEHGGAVLLPAPAGMVPPPNWTGSAPSSAPRTRGDGPSGDALRPAPQSCSPHPRGWSHRRRRCARPAQLLPAPAGMVPTDPISARITYPAPRTRGDGPLEQFCGPFSGSCSPHPRGWSQGDRGVPEDGELLPAPAGMVPPSRTGWPPSGTAPRTRGDGPPIRKMVGSFARCSPHPRGWSRLGHPGPRGRLLLPAPAGMVPGGEGTGLARRAAPRTRGDGPPFSGISRPPDLCSPHPRGWSLPRPGNAGALGCSPHPRGWSRAQGSPRRDHPLLPAPAGMVPAGRTCRSRDRPAP